MKSPEPRITVGDLIDHLKVYDRDHELSFSGLTFYRLKQRGPKLVQVEFAQSIDYDPTGKKWLVFDP